MEELNNCNFAETAAAPDGSQETVTIFGNADGGEISPELLREQYDITNGDDFRDYGKLKLIGLGGMGMVFQAQDMSLQRKVALKILRSDFRNRRASVKKFIHEARITAKIDHPNIVPVHRMGVLENIGVYFTMKRIHGENLREIFDKISAGNQQTVQHYTLRRMLDIFIAACNGVAAAHAHGVLHCDLKPGNIMIGRFGEILVLDWGVAREKIPQGPRRIDEKVFSEEDGVVEGTPVFMAPELLCKEVVYPDEQTDVYGLGAILYTILTRGRLPFDITEGTDAVIKKVVSGDIIPIRHNLPKGEVFHNELAAICAKAMARDRLERYNTVEALREDIYNYLDGFPVSACSPTLFDRFFKLIRRRPLIPAVLLTIALSMASYYGFTKLQEAINLNALQEIIRDNVRAANTNRLLALRRFKMLNNQQLSTEDRLTTQRNLYSAAANATVEYNIVFDAVSRLNRPRQKQFLHAGGCEMFIRVFRMNMRLGNWVMVKELLGHCRSQWRDLFAAARRINPQLDELILNIEKQLKSQRKSSGGKK